MHTEFRQLPKGLEYFKQSSFTVSYCDTATIQRFYWAFLNTYIQTCDVSTVEGIGKKAHLLATVTEVLGGDVPQLVLKSTLWATQEIGVHG